MNAHLYITTDCNLKCKHCYSAENQQRGNILQNDEIISIVRTLCEHYDIYFDIEGGELFLHDEQWLRQLTEAERSRIVITTNGTIVQSIPPIYFKQLDAFRVSIEGYTDELHRLLRGVSLQPILDNCVNWINQGIRVAARVTVNKRNVSSLQQLFDRLVPLGFRRFELYEFQAVGRGKQYEHDYCMDDHDFETLVRGLEQVVTVYPNLDYVKLCLPEARDQRIAGQMSSLQRLGFLVEDVSLFPSVTVNVDGSVGICPWEIADYEQLNIRTTPLLTCMQKILLVQPVRHACQHCTNTKILFRGSAI